MKKSVRLIINVLICSIMLFVFQTPIAFASNNNTTDEMNEYIENAIPFYLRASSTYVAGVLSYSNPIPVYNLETGEKEFDYIFIFDDSQIIGKISLYSSNAYTSTFDKHITNIIQTSYNNQTINKYFTYNDNIYIKPIEGDLILFDGFRAVSNIPEITDILYDNVLINKVNTITYDNVSVAAISSNVQLNVQHVHNDETPAGKGLCWAACIAMKLNYQRDVNTYTALSVYNLTQSDPDNHAASTPHGYEVMGYTPVTEDGSISASEVLGQLSRNYPVHISMEGTNAAGKSVYHAVLISGITVDNATSTSADITYSICDPNNTATQYMYRSMSMTAVNDSINYKTSYTTWYHTYY